MVELMIGNALDKTLGSLGRDDCLSLENSMDMPGSMNASKNLTSLEEECNQLKVEMAITLAFLTGIIMVHLQHNINASNHN